MQNVCFPFHFVRFDEALRLVTDKLDSKNFYQFNPEFDSCPRKNPSPDSR